MGCEDRCPGRKIPKNAIVVVEGIQGVKLIVRNGEETKDMMAAVMEHF